jgi:RimJ/RimL family protein N-acetyltransferase
MLAHYVSPPTNLSDREILMSNPQLPFSASDGVLPWTSRDGRELRIRHITPEDADRLVDFYTRLSERTRELRFATLMMNVPMERIIAEATRLATLNPKNADALVAILEEDGEDRIVAVARLAGAHGNTAEFALTVRDDFQGLGLGTYIFDLLVQVALVHGLKYLTAITLAENIGMLKIIRRVGFPVGIHTSHGESDVVIYLDDKKDNPAG